MGRGERWIGGDGFREEEGLGRKMGWVMAMGWLREMACSTPRPPFRLTLRAVTRPPPSATPGSADGLL